jgi:hypothetical protein
MSEFVAPRHRRPTPCLAKLDRLAWAGGIAFRAYGLDLGVRVNDLEVLDRVARALPYGWRPSKRPGVDHMYSVIASSAPARSGSRPRLRRFHMLYSEATQLLRTQELDHLLEVFESDARRTVAEFSTERVFVHAGVVGWRGHAILVPGRTFSGKTSLVAEFVRAGATYYSDEFAVLDARGRVHPFLKPLSMRESEDYRQTDRAVEEIGGTSGTKPLPVGCVVVTEFREGARWAPRTLTTGQAVLSLLANTVSARRIPSAALAALRHAAANATALKGRRGEASEAVPAILAALGD